MYANLSLQNAPSIETPFRFFASAPFFVILAAVIILVSGPELYTSRWNPNLLALTHSITLGFINMCMLGAVFQIVPVVTGSSIKHATRLALFIYSVYTSGVVALLTGFLLTSPIAFKLAAGLLVISLGSFLLFVIKGLFENHSRLAAAKGMRLSLVSLLIALCIALILIAAYAWPSLTLLRQYTGLHIIWAALGWVVLTIISVSYQAIPMFQITGEYPVQLQKYLAPFIFINLILYSLFYIMDINQGENTAALVILLLICLSLAVYIVASVLRLWQRKKQMPDASLWFWLTGLASLLASIGLYLLNVFYHTETSILLGIVFFYGGVVSIITAMLLKIIPFLIWFNLHRQLSSNGKLSDIPLMTAVINYQKSRRLFFIYLTSLLTTCLAVHLPDIFFYPSGLFILLFGLALFTAIYHAILLYREHRA